MAITKCFAVFVLSFGIFANATEFCSSVLGKAKDYGDVIKAVNWARSEIASVNNPNADLDIIKMRMKYAEDMTAKFLTSHGVMFREVHMAEFYSFWPEDRSFTRSLQVGNVNASPLNRRVFLLTSPGEFESLKVLFGGLHNPEFTKNILPIVDPMADLSGPMAIYRPLSKSIFISLLAFANQYYHADYNSISRVTLDAISKMHQKSQRNILARPVIEFLLPAIGSEIKEDRFQYLDLERELAEINSIAQSLRGFADFYPTGSIQHILKEVLLVKLHRLSERTIAAKEAIEDVNKELISMLKLPKGVYHFEQYQKGGTAVLSLTDHYGRNVRALFEAAFHWGTSSRILAEELRLHVSSMDNFQAQIAKLRHEFPEKAPNAIDRWFRKVAHKLTDKLGPELHVPVRH